MHKPQRAEQYVTVNLFEFKRRCIGKPKDFILTSINQQICKSIRPAVDLSQSPFTATTIPLENLSGNDKFLLFFYVPIFIAIFNDNTRFFDILFHRSQNSNLQAFKTILSVFSLR